MRLCRSFVVGLLAVALSSQLVEGQVLRCADMKMSETTMQSMQSSATGKHNTTAYVSSRSDKDTQQQTPVSSGCVASATCLVGPAVLPMLAAVSESAIAVQVVVSAMKVPATRALRPDFPPPRF